MTRNITLDYLKLILSIMIIILHFPFGIYDNTTLATFYDSSIGRIAVPLFFLINGYFLNNLNLNKLKKYLSHLLLIYLVWQAVYAPFYIRGSVKYFIFDMIIGYEHLWYISALIMASVMLYLYQKISNNKKLLFCISVLLFFIGYIIQNDHPRDYFLYRNAIFFAFPFISIGYLIRQISDVNKYKKPACITFIIGFIVSYFEVFYYSIPYPDLIISLLIICPALFIFILSISKIGESTGYISDLSAGIYFVHFAMCIMVSHFYTDSNTIILLLPPIIIISILFSAMIISLNKRLKIFL